MQIINFIKNNNNRYDRVRYFFMYNVKIEGKAIYIQKEKKSLL